MNHSTASFNDQDRRRIVWAAWLTVMVTLLAVTQIVSVNRAEAAPPDPRPRPTSAPDTGAPEVRGAEDIVVSLAPGESYCRLEGPTCEPELEPLDPRIYVPVDPSIFEPLPCAPGQCPPPTDPCPSSTNPQCPPPVEPCDDPKSTNQKCPPPTDPCEEPTSTDSKCPPPADPCGDPLPDSCEPGDSTTPRDPGTPNDPGVDPAVPGRPNFTG